MEWWQIIIISLIIGWVCFGREKNSKRIDDLEDRIGELEDKLEPESDVDYPIMEEDEEK